MNDERHTKMWVAETDPLADASGTDGSPSALRTARVSERVRLCDPHLGVPLIYSSSEKLRLGNGLRRPLPPDRTATGSPGGRWQTSRALARPSLSAPRRSRSTAGASPAA